MYVCVGAQRTGREVFQTRWGNALCSPIRGTKDLTFSENSQWLHVLCPWHVQYVCIIMEDNR